MDIKQLKTSFDSFIDTKVVPLKTGPKAGICAAALLVPAALFYFLFFSPKSDEIGQLENNVKQLQTQLAEVKAQAGKLAEQKQIMADLEEKFKEAALLIPDKKEIPSLLASVSSQGSSAGLDILAFVPSAEVPKDFYAEIPVSLSLSGTYHNVGYFLDTVSKLPRIVNVNKVTMTTPKLTDGEMVVETKIDLVTYKFIEPGDAAKAPPKNAKK